MTQLSGQTGERTLDKGSAIRTHWNGESHFFSQLLSFLLLMSGTQEFRKPVVVECNVRSVDRQVLINFIC